MELVDVFLGYLENDFSFCLEAVMVLSGWRKIRDIQLGVVI